MKSIHNFEEAREVLAKFVPSRGTTPYKLDNMRRLMTELGDPQNSYRVVHVAGTSGKTSTSYYVAALLGQTGKKVGLTVSPHVDEVNERLQVNLAPMPEVEFCSVLEEFLSVIEKSDIKPSYFELLVALAYWEFARQKVDYAVVEVGLGGLLDGTNVISRPDKVCVITDIGLDHTNVLGGDLTSIAYQKAGIITSHNPVFTYEQDQKVMDEIKKRCETEHAQLFAITEPKNSAHHLPIFQQHNFGLAQEVAEYIVARDTLKPLGKVHIHKASLTYVPARMETIEVGGKLVILDGAHNPQKMGALVNSLRDKFPNRKMTVLLGLLSGKDLKGVVKELMPITDNLIATSFAAEQDMPRQSIDPKEIIAAAKAQGITSTKKVTKPEEAFKTALEGKNPLVLVAGSFFLLNHIRPLIFKADD